jgi:hypothetical protein
MKTFKASNYAQALKEIHSLDSEKAEIIKEEINFEDRNHYHVAMVRITDRPGEAKNEVSVNIQLFHEAGFRKLEKNFPFLGWNKLVVIHDPNQNPIEETIAPEAGSVAPPVITKTQEEIEAEIEAKADAKANELFEARIAKIEADKAKAGSVAPTKGNKLDTDQQLEFFGSATVDQLKEYAKDNEIDLSGLKVKEDIKATILAWYEDQPKA